MSPVACAHRVGVQCLWVDEVAAQREGGRVGAGHVGEGGEGLRDLRGAQHGELRW